MDGDAEIYLTKASESLLTAESEWDYGRYNSCANRCYYACFQAAIAALLWEGIRPADRWSHAYVQAQFVGQLVNRRKRYGADLRRTLVDIQALRIKADDGTDMTDRTRASRALDRSRGFVAAVGERGALGR